MFSHTKVPSLLSDVHKYYPMSTHDTVQADAAEHGSAPVTVRLSPEELRKAQLLARRDHRTRAAFIRVMYLRGLADYEKQLETATA